MGAGNGLCLRFFGGQLVATCPAEEDWRMVGIYVLGSFSVGWTPVIGNLVRF